MAPDGYGTPAPQPSPEAEPYPAPGELKLKQKLAFKPWQVSIVAILALVIGMALNYSGGGSGATPTGSNSGGAYSLPPSGGTTTTTSQSGVTTTTAGSSESSDTTTTTESAGTGGTTTSVATEGATTTPGSSTTSTTSATSGSATTLPSSVLLPATQRSGNWTSPAFTTTQPDWNLGWAFQCVPPPSAGPSIQIFVVPVGASASGTPAVAPTGGSGQSVTTLSTLGQQELVVEAPANCEWAVKVTGS